MLTEWNTKTYVKLQAACSEGKRYIFQHLFFWNTMGDAGTMKEVLHSWAFRRRNRRLRACDVAPSAIMWVIWKERNMRAFEGVDNDLVKLQNNLLSSFFLMYPWGTYVYFFHGEPYSVVGSPLFGIGLYTGSPHH